MTTAQTNIDRWEWNAKDILTVELQSRVAKGIVSHAESKDGKPILLQPEVTVQIDVTGKDLDCLAAMLETETEDIKRLAVAHAARRNREKEHRRKQAERSNSPLSEVDLDNELHKWDMSNTWQRTFYEQFGRGVKPLKFIKVIDNHGPKATTENQAHQTRELIEAMKASFEALANDKGKASTTTKRGK